MTVMLDRDGSDFTRTRRLGLARFETQIRKEVRRWEAAKPCLRIARKVFAALTDPAGVLAHRAGAVERVALVLHDWHQSKRRCADIQTRMTTLLDELKLTELVTSIPGLSPVGAAAILAETGNLHRFTSARALVKHAGLAPREKASGGFVGRTKVTAQGRPGLRLAAWRAGWAAIKGNEVYAARFTHLTARDANKLSPTQAQAAVEAALLRQLHAVVNTGRRWDPEIAIHGTGDGRVTPSPPEPSHQR